AVVGSIEASGVAPTGSGPVEVDHAIEGVAGSYPMIDSLPQHLTFPCTKIAAIDTVGAEERRERPSEDLDATGVRHRDQATIAPLDRRSCDRRITGRKAAGVVLSAEADVVDALKKDHCFHPRLGQRVTPETRQGTLPEARRIVEHSVPTDARIHDGRCPPPQRGVETPR